jgi:hypothetical protein
VREGDSKRNEPFISVEILADWDGHQALPRMVYPCLLIWQVLNRICGIVHVTLRRL